MGKLYNVTFGDCPSIGITGILCTEAASGYLGLSSYEYNSFPIFLYSSDLNGISRIQSVISYLGVPEKLDYTNTLDIGNDIHVTNKEQTICDLIRFDCDTFTTLESIYNYYAYEGNEAIMRLEALARKYGILDTLQKMLIQAEEDFEEL